jgi:tetratricopeptide (TPR) repeat protein
MFKSIVVLIILTVLSSGCSSPKLTLLTSPEKAMVYAKSIGTGQKTFLGETPLTISHEKIESTYGGNGPIYIEFIKQGYMPFRVYVTELSLIQTEMRADLTPRTGLEDQAQLNGIVESMFESQRLTKIKRYDEALRVLNEVQDKVPFISSIYEMKGGIYYLRGSYRDAYDYYSKAVTLNPKNADARRMKDYLHSSYGYNSLDDPMDIQAYSRTPAGANKDEKKSPESKKPASVLEPAKSVEPSKLEAQGVEATTSGSQKGGN